MEDTYIKPSEKGYLGKNGTRIRELKGLKQEPFAAKFGISRQPVSQLEQKETIDREKPDEIARALGVTPKATKASGKNAAIRIINSNTFHDNSSNNCSGSGSSFSGTGCSYNYQPTFNPLDKVMEFSLKVQELYTALLESEKEKNKVFAEANKTVLRLTEELREIKAGKR